MALIVACSRCGFILKRIEAEEASLSARSPLLLEVARKYGSRCPRCMKPLSSKPESIEVQPAGKVSPRQLKAMTSMSSWPSSLLGLVKRWGA
ncbi:MAG: hypothetical protein DRJ97_02610 [Thermoprotei archaeon]|nr:MAG: hypothetical protein DRJ97_02610 [Thermoprotei archaeon]